MTTIGQTLSGDNVAQYLLLPRPAALSENPLGSNLRSYWDAPHAYRLWPVTLRAQGPNGDLISHNLQVKIGAPDMPRARADEDVVLRLQSGWWVTLRHEFASAPKTGTGIVRSAADELSAFTAQVTDARGEQAMALAMELDQRQFRATGPAVWPGRA